MSKNNDTFQENYNLLLPPFFSIMSSSFKNLKEALTAKQTSNFPIYLFGGPNFSIRSLCVQEGTEKATTKVCEQLADDSASIHNLGAEPCGSSLLNPIEPKGLEDRQQFCLTVSRQTQTRRITCAVLMPSR